MGESCKAKKMEIRGQLNVRVMLWYKRVSLLLLKCVRPLTVPLLQAEKKRPEKTVFKKKKSPFLSSAKASWVFSFLVLLSPAFPLMPFGEIRL